MIIGIYTACILTYSHPQTNHTIKHFLRGVKCMKINALLIDDIDNVVTCVAEVPAGSEVFYRKGEEILSLKAEEDIPYCHKIALKDFAKGDEVIKYGEMIGKTLEPIAKGRWVWDKNIYSVPRDYASEMIKLEG